MDGRSFCRIHFYEFARKRLEDSRSSSAKDGAATTSSPAIAKFLSELVSQATALVAGAKYMTEMQRNQFLELSLSAVELYKCLQRNPRFKRKVSVVLRPSTEASAVGEQEISVVIRSSADTGTRGEFTSTLNVSKTGACLETSSAWEVSQEIWIERADNRQVTRARVVWVKKVSASKYLLGAEILNCEDFWGVE
jgi:hypothetical protein